MGRIEVPSRRSTIHDSPSGLEIVIPARRNFFTIAFIGFWLIGWACGEVFAIRQLFVVGKSPDFPGLFLLAWLGGWTVGGGFAIYAWLWTVVGKERIILRPGTLATKREVLGFGRSREYDLSHVSNVRISQQSHNPFDFGSGMRSLGIGGGMIAFDYGAKTFRFGASIDEVEAEDIVEELKKRHTF